MLVKKTSAVMALAIWSLLIRPNNCTVILQYDQRLQMVSMSYPSFGPLCVSLPAVSYSTTLTTLVLTISFSPPLFLINAVLTSSFSISLVLPIFTTSFLLPLFSATLFSQPHSHYPQFSLSLFTQPHYHYPGSHQPLSH